MALFTPTAAAVYRGVVIGLAVTVIAAICAPMLFIRTGYASGQGDPVEQPVEFDHRHHVRDAGIACVYCHSSVETDAFAGMPATERCMGCHAQVWTDSPETAPVRASWKNHTPIRWQRINAVPDHVYFHHGVHVQAGVQCTTCHGDVANMARVTRAHDLSMSMCVDCHRRVQGSRAITHLTTCTACHR